MAIKVYRKNKAARRKSSMVNRKELHGGGALKSLRRAKRRISGRGSEGKITIRHRGGGAKRNWREIDFGQTKQEVPGKVERIEFDPNRSSFIALILFADGERRYMLAWDGAKEGAEIMVKEKAKEKPGYRMMLKNVTPGATVYNVELSPGRGGTLQRSAGSYATLMGIKDKHALLKLSSGEVRMVSKESWANYGAVSNSDHRLVRIGSAGRKRRMGRRPQVRGKVMNPVDHPHGGGEGAQPIGLKHPKTPWGKPALGVRTRRKNRYSEAMIVARRQRKKRK